MASKALFCLAVIALISCVYAAAGEYGHCKLVGTSDATITGSVYFSPDPTNSSLVRIWADISGITQNLGTPHGMHVHQWGDLSDTTTAAVGTHYAGVGTGIHGCSPDETRDSGDMGNWDVSAEGTVQQGKSLDLLYLTGGTSIIGRAVVLHSLTDNCVNISSSGGRIARCVIGVGNPTSWPTTQWTEGAPSSNSAQNPGSASDAGHAIAILHSTNQTTNTITATVFFQQVDANTLKVIATVNGLPANTSHGLHVHEFGDLSTNDGQSVGGHYNPLNTGHGLPPSTSRHQGDMGSICSFDSTGVAWYSYDNTLSTLSGANSLIGRGVVIHAIPDDGTTNYGARWAQGVIGIANPATAAPTVPITVAAPDCGAPAATTSSTSTATTTTTGSTTTSGASAIASSVFLLIVAILSVIAL